MTNPPDFVMYVVMVKARGRKKFDPDWMPGGTAYGFRRKSTAQRVANDYQRIYGKKNAYVQQYGPIS